MSSALVLFITGNDCHHQEQQYFGYMLNEKWPKKYHQSTDQIHYFILYNHHLKLKFIIFCMPFKQ